MFALGGFELTKFLIDSKQVLQSIDEADRRKEVEWPTIEYQLFFFNKKY